MLMDSNIRHGALSFLVGLTQRKLASLVKKSSVAGALPTVRLAMVSFLPAYKFSLLVVAMLLRKKPTT